MSPEDIVDSAVASVGLKGSGTCMRAGDFEAGVEKGGTEVRDEHEFQAAAIYMHVRDFVEGGCLAMEVTCNLRRHEIKQRVVLLFTPLMPSFGPRVVTSTDLFRDSKHAFHTSRRTIVVSVFLKVFEHFSDEIRIVERTVPHGSSYLCTT